MGDACSRMKQGKVEISEIQVSCDTRDYKGKDFHSQVSGDVGVLYFALEIIW